MYLWDANIVRYFGQGHLTLRLHLLRVPWAEIALPLVVEAEVLRGRCDFALKASPCGGAAGNTDACWKRSRCSLGSMSSFSTNPAPR